MYNIYKKVCQKMNAHSVVYAILRCNMNQSMYTIALLTADLLTLRNNKSPLMNTLMISSHLNASLIRVKLLMPSNHRGNDPGIRPSLISPTSRMSDDPFSHRPLGLRSHRP